MKGHLFLVCPVVVVCLWSTPAQSQIYALRDDNGVLTLSDKPLGEGAQTYSVPGASGFRTTTVPVFGTLRSSAWVGVERK
jgi:hypothetical protein